jgi:hypothetical protein
VARYHLSNSDCNELYQGALEFNQFKKKLLKVKPSLQRSANRRHLDLHKLHTLSVRNNYSLHLTAYPAPLMRRRDLQIKMQSTSSTTFRRNKAAILKTICIHELQPYRIPL